MSPTPGKWKKNEARDGWMPCCGKCGEPFSDAHPGDVKNYPDDGLVAVFFKCDNCTEPDGFGGLLRLESIFYYKPMRK